MPIDSGIKGGVVGFRFVLFSDTRLLYEKEKVCWEKIKSLFSYWQVQNMCIMNG